LNNQRLTEKRKRRRKRLAVLIGVGSVVAIVVLAIVIDSALYYNKVHTGVKVSTLSLGGLTRDEATAALTRWVEDAQESPVVLTSGDGTWPVMPADVGTKIDVEGAVSAAMDVSRRSNFVVDLFKRCKLYFADEEIALAGTVDSAKMDEVLGAIAEELDIPPVNAGLAIDGAKIKVIEGQKGTVVDQESLRESLKAVLFTLHSTELEIPMTVKEPEVQADDTQAAREAAETMVSASVKLTSGDKTWTLSPEDIALYMDFTSEDQGGVSTLVPYLSAEKMAPFFADIADGVATEPISATFDSDGSKAWVVPGVVGKKLDAENTAVALTAAALETTGRKAEAAVTTAEPELTTDEAKAMGIADKLYGFTTEPYSGTADRQHNVRLTTKLASDVFLAPGEVYNFLELVGPRTAERGFKQAKGIVGQGVLEDVLGGGICQVSTTIFNAAFFAGLEIVERWNHSLYISHYPKGRDATATGTSEDGKNLRFKNDTDHYIWVRGVSDGVTTTFNIYGTSDGRKVSHTTSDFYDNVAQTQTSVTNTSLGPGTTVIQSSGQPGRTCTVKRTITWPDGTTKTDKFVSRFPMYPKVIEVGSGTTTTSTTIPGSSTSTTDFIEF
jgi:vancomycin resistance protein YoaR